MPSSPKRVLIYRLGSLGDTVVALPALHLVARAFPEAERRMLTNFPVSAKAPAAAAILENTGLVHRYFRYAAGTRSPRELLSLWWQLMRWRPQAVVYLGAARGIESASRDARFFRLCGIRRLIGVPLTEDMQRNRSQHAGDTFEFEVERLARNISELGDANLEDTASWDLHLTPKEQERANQIRETISHRPFIAVSIGTKAQANEWDREKWRELLARLALLYPGHALLLNGAAVDTAASEFVADGWRNASDSISPGPVLNLCGQLTPRESAAIFAHADLFMGHDSGPMHLAAAVQVPCVAVFSARNKPRVWYPYGRQHRILYHRTDCWGCRLETCTIERKKCITSISVEEVLAEVQAVLRHID